ncbi:hypothetical protein L6164_035290 [Bauhinia variegata]|uniref:Uncharacterized protein n=1 Tax=Bauhinia variegata TaxID=167791 RepID=A0ACB9KXP9_BAUVA|nr:hypothetical protein L6164_035290 [Bauhinia variegata]
MADKGIIDVDNPKHPNLNGHSGSRNIRKRKRTLSWPENLCAHEKEAHIEAFQKELDGLFEYYKEVKDQKLVIELNECGSRNAVIACLMEESELPLSRLVDEIYNKLKKVDDRVVLEPLTYALVKSSVLYVGQRLMYGVPNADADVLEDDSESCFWCWETRDVKLIPKSIRGKFVIRRTCRRRIHERIMAVTEMITALKEPDNEQNFKHSLMKGLEKLRKANTEAEIRSLVYGLLQRNSVDMDTKEAKRQEKLMLKQLERNKRAVERESENLHSELQKGILLSVSEKDMNLLQGEERKDERCREKDSSERRKHQRQQPEVAEKDKRRREKEEAELKKKRSLQKQASIMESFLKRNKTSPSCQNDKLSTKAIPSDLSNRSKNVSESATLSMDCTLASSNEITIEVIHKSHLSSWRYLGQSIRSNRKQGWGLRKKPKTELFKELKLTVTRVVACDDELGVEKLVDGMGEWITDTRLCPTSTDTSLDIRKCCQGKQLLQFENGHRPAFYGVWPKKSHVVGPRCPFRKDPNLEYDISSDEEWEEEGPGETLSDCDKDEEESLEECSKSDDDENEDGFFVPDGYLSEDEGAQLERMGRDIDIEGTGSSPSCKDNIESEEFCALLRQQKYLNSLTEHALRKNQPLIIPNLMHDKASLLLAHNLSGTLKLEQTCLLTLSMRVISINSHTEISDKTQNEDQEAFLSTVKGGTASITDMAAEPAIMESDLPVIVSTIQTSQGINEVLESLQQKFPAVSKSILRNKVCELSDYVDNSLQVRKEVLVKLGLALYPEKSSRGAESITNFLSKRCLPPTGESMNPGETSPLPTVKPGSAAVLKQQSWTCNL